MENLDLLLLKLYFRDEVVPQLKSVERWGVPDENWPTWTWNSGELYSTFYPIYGCQCKQCREIENSMFQWTTMLTQWEEDRFMKQQLNTSNT